MSEGTDFDDPQGDPAQLYEVLLEEGAPPRGGRCPVCGSENHGADAHSDQRGAPPAAQRCARCGSENHLTPDCPLSRRDK